jgi:hypothetical protein
MVLYKGNIFYVDEKFKNGYVKKKGLKGPKREMCMEFVFRNHLDHTLSINEY